MKKMIIALRLKTGRLFSYDPLKEVTKGIFYYPDKLDRFIDFDNKLLFFFLIFTIYKSSIGKVGERFFALISE